MSDHHSYADLNMQQNAGHSSNQWLEKQQNSRSRKSKWIVIGSILGIVALIVIGVAVGVSVSKNKKSSNNLSTSNSGTAGAVNQTNPNDPSTFQRDPKLKHSFYGLAYEPNNVIYPACGATLPEVIEDVQLMSQLTSRIRLYGADCNVSALVLEAIVQTKVNMTVWLANFIVDGDPTAYDRQKTAIQGAIQTYGTDHISGITVGNEFMLNYLEANGGTDPNSAVGNAGAQLLITNITDTRNMLKQLNVDLPVGTSDAGSYFNTEVLEAVDFGMSNVHPWFANVSIDQAATWTWEFFQENNVIVTENLTNKPEMYIAETGWPSASSDVSHESDGPSVASEANLQTFLDTFVCQANTNGTKYFYFEFFDEKWQDLQYGGVEGHWGLFYENKTLKGVTLPDCVI
jgi:exo-beta-1,3-glucanase (GH17 family)